MYDHCAGDNTDDTDSTEPEVINHSPQGRQQLESLVLESKGHLMSPIQQSRRQVLVLTQVQQQRKMILTVVDLAAAEAWSQKTQTAQSW